MVDEYVLDYIKKHYKESSLEDLKKQVTLAGYSEKDFEKALKKLKADKDFKISFESPSSLNSKITSKKVVEPNAKNLVIAPKIVKPVNGKKVSKPTAPISNTIGSSVNSKREIAKSSNVIPVESDKTLLSKFFSGFSRNSKVALKNSSVKAVKPKAKREKFSPIVKPVIKSISKGPSEPSIGVFPVSIEHHPHVRESTGEFDEDSSISVVSSKIPGPIYRSNSRMAGVYSILAVIFVILFFVLEYFFAGAAEYRPMPISIISLILVSIFLMFFYYGFVVMGRRYNKKFMEFAGWIFVIAVIFSFIIFVSLLISPARVSDFMSRYMISISFDRLSFDLIFQGIFNSFLLWIFVGLNILFGIGMVTLRKGIKYTAISGILHIIGGILLLFGFGIIVLLIAFLFEIILFFRETKKG